MNQFYAFPDASDITLRHSLTVVFFLVSCRLLHFVSLAFFTRQAKDLRCIFWVSCVHVLVFSSSIHKFRRTKHFERVKRKREKVLSSLTTNICFLSIHNFIVSLLKSSFLLSSLWLKNDFSFSSHSVFSVFIHRAC